MSKRFDKVNKKGIFAIRIIIVTWRDQKQNTYSMYSNVKLALYDSPHPAFKIRARIRFNCQI